MTTGAERRTAGDYTLRVEERLSARWADWFDGFTLTAQTDGTTALTGAVTDQAQLHGLLTKIRDLGLTLVSVEEGQPPRTPDGDLRLPVTSGS